MKKLAISLVVVAISACGSGMQSFLDSNAPLSSLGWYDYESSRWSEASAQDAGRHVVQLGMRERLWCEEQESCYATSHVTELREGNRTLCPDELANAGTPIPAQHSVGAFTGVMVESERGKTSIVTVKHGRKYLGDDVLFGHDAEHAEEWLNADEHTLVVPSEFVGKIDKTRTRVVDGVDLMILELSDGHGVRSEGARLAKQVAVGDTVYAFVHVFGLPMKMVGPAQVSMCSPDGLACWVEADFAVGGSGGPLFSRSGELAGVLVGEGLEWTSYCTHGHTDVVHPCAHHGSGCGDREGRDGQKFVTASAIRDALVKGR